MELQFECSLRGPSKNVNVSEGQNVLHPCYRAPGSYTFTECVWFKRIWKNKKKHIVLLTHEKQRDDLNSERLVAKDAVRC